jgi:hypothetical protein
MTRRTPFVVIVVMYSGCREPKGRLVDEFTTMKVSHGRRRICVEGNNQLAGLGWKVRAKRRQASNLKTEANTHTASERQHE